MNIFHCNPKTVSNTEEPSLSSSSGFLRRTFPALLMLAVWFVLAAGGGIGVDAVYADTIEVWVSADEDDAEESASGSIDLTSSDLELIRSGDQTHVGMRFTNIDIPQGALINNAYIEFAVDETGYDEATTLVFHGQAHNNATAFTSTSLNISTRATTTASVTWNIDAGDQWTPAHTKYQSPDLTSIIQEIVDRSGWSSNNALVIIVTGSGKRTVESYDGADGHGDVTLAAKLFIDHDGGSDKATTCRIFYRANQQAQASSTTSLSVGMPPGTTEGDLMIATVAFGDGDAVLSAPAGWTLIEPSSPGGEAMRTSAWYKVAGASEAGPYVFSASGAGDEMLVDIATFYSSAGADVLAWDLEDSSYKYPGVEETVINSNKVDCVDTSLIYFAGSDDIAANVSNPPSSMTVLAEQQQSLLSLATYYQFRDSGKDLIKTIQWADPADFLSAIAAVFSCQSVVEYDIDATAGPNGSISPSGSISVPETGSKTFSIIPDSGYVILDVIVDGTSEGAVNSYTFNDVKENHSITASFSASSYYIISTSPGSNGSISPAGPVAVAPGASETFTIIPDDGYVVDEVTVDGKQKGAETSWTFSDVQEGHSIAATFKVDTADPPDDSCVEISDVPLDARFESAPPNILIALDDSGSMSFEILVPGAIDGKYMDFNDYLFDNPCGDTFGNTPGCHEYDRDSILGRGDRRLHWKTQWAEYNKVYYDPSIDYQPWPLVTGQMDNADANNPRSHPMYSSPTFDLSSSYEILTISVAGEVIVDNEDADAFSMTGPWEFFTDPQAYPDVEPNKDGYYSAIQEGQDYTATWAPYLLAGQYEVYVRYVAADWRDDKVAYTITHADGTDTKEVDQRSGGGEWIKLGDYNFNTGKADVTLNHHVCHSDHARAAADAVKFVPKDAGGYSIDIDIPRAHYYVYSPTENKPYLVTVDGGSIEYYEFDDANGDDIVGADELNIVVTPPADVKTGRTYVEERQNFANWYTYYRRRGFTATYATAELITHMQAVRIGLYGINIGKDWTITQPVLNVKNDGQDFTESLLNLLYDFKWQGGTPLRRALEAGGRYFDKHDNKKLGECQQAFTIVITDGYYNGSAPQHSSINNNDGDDGEPYADSYSDTLADVAMYYYERDLNTGLADNVPENASDDASHQHMVTYSIGFGVIGTINPDDYDDDLKHKDTEDYIVWSDATVGRSTPEKVDDVWHAAVNGRGQFLNSSNPQELVSALNAVMKDIERRVFSASGVAINGDELYQRLEPDLLMFQARYSSEGWTGDIKAFKVDEFSGEVDTLNPDWTAAELLDSKSWTTRIIATHSGTNGIPFRFDSLTDAQKDLLDTDWATDDTHARNMMDYLHGDTSEEERNGGAFRNRFTVLGEPMTACCTPLPLPPVRSFLLTCPTWCLQTFTNLPILYMITSITWIWPPP
jgi:hypothetical protein